MNQKPNPTSGVGISRRTLLGATAAGVGVGSFAGISLAQVEKTVEKLKAEGWEAHPTACCMCGARCGMLAMKKKGAKLGPDTVRIFPNPSHPQRGYCGRGAQTLWLWNHPLRIKKPLKRKGERGSGEFEEISWDQALNEIAAKLKEITEKYGERSVLLTSHNFTGYQQWFAQPFGTPNVVNHSATCNSASTLGRRMIFGPAYNGVGAVDPDYGNARYLLLVGRTLNCAAGIFGHAAAARENGCKLVFVDPRMPEGALGDATWIPIKPGTDGAFLQGLIHIGLKEGLCDLDWVKHWTNGPVLVHEDLRPVTENEVVEGGSARRFAVVDEATGTLMWQGPKLNEKGAVVGFDHDPLQPLLLSHTTDVTFLNGKVERVSTAFDAFRKVNDRYTPEETSKITGVPVDTLVETARDFFKLKGVCDDGWYSSRNANDVEAFGMMNVINLFTGRFDREGGLIATQGGGYGGAPGIKRKDGMCLGPTGVTWDPPKGKPLDKEYYPEGIGSFHSTFEAMKTGKPYPIRALFITGGAMFHREANSARMIEAFKSLDLIVAQDLMPQESNDYADYVLPSTFFLENHEYLGVTYARDGYVQRSSAEIDPPEGVEARHDIWQFLEILRRAYPERAARVGYTEEIKDRAGWKAWWDQGLVEAGWKKWIASKNAAKPGEGDRILKDVDEKGWSLTIPKKYDNVPYRKPFPTPTGKAELLSFFIVQRPHCKGIRPIPEYVPVTAYTAPKPLSDEFVLVSGKDGVSGAGCTIFTWPTKYLGDRTFWMNPVDADRLGIKTGDTVEVEGLDNHVKGRVKITVTNRVRVGSLFVHGFAGGVRTKKLPENYAWVREGINSNWLTEGVSQVACGNMNNNTSVRVKRV